MKRYLEFVVCALVSLAISWVLISVQFAFLADQPIAMIIEWTKIVGMLAGGSLVVGIPVAFSPQEHVPSC